MNTKILAQNIVNNPSDFTAEQIEKYFEDYAELHISDTMNSITLNKLEIWLINTLRWNINDILIAREQKKDFVNEWLQRYYH